jgi:minichromosome maintenance protein 10
MQGFKPKPARAFTTTASERDREQATRDQARAAQARVETVEKYSGLRIKNRVVAGMVVEDRFNDLRFYRLKDLRHTISGRWATAGVLVEKSVKQSSNGGSYSVWKLSDLGRDDVCVSVFLFGQAHIDNWKEPEGTIWSIVDAQLNESKGERDKGRPSATVDGKDPRALWKLGASADFGRCKGARKDGNNCTMHVNRSLTEYCAYHAASALKAFRQSDRMNVGVRRAPKFTVNGRTVLGTKGEFICYFRMGNWTDGVFCSTLTGNGSAPNMPPGAHAGGYRPHTAGATNRGTNQHQAAHTDVRRGGTSCDRGEARVGSDGVEGRGYARGSQAGGRDGQGEPGGSLRLHVREADETANGTRRRRGYHVVRRGGRGFSRVRGQDQGLGRD